MLVSACPPGRYGANCRLTCYCYGRSKCNHITGSCICPPGYHGYGCWQGTYVHTLGHTVLYMLMNRSLQKVCCELVKDQC